MIAAMDPESPATPTGPRDVAEHVRGMTGVPWRRLLGYLRPHLVPFSIALVGLLVGSGLGLPVPLVDRGARDPGRRGWRRGGARPA